MRKWPLLLVLILLAASIGHGALAAPLDSIPIAPLVPFEEATPVTPDASSTQAAPLSTDLPLLVNNDNPLPDGYKPVELVKLFDHKRSFKLADSDIYVEAHVFQAMNEMFAAARKDGVTGFIVTSGYRTEKDQIRLYKNDTEGVAAKPGHSEHQTGLAFDVSGGGNENFAKTDLFKWLRYNCWDYGFIIRYPKGKEQITGIPFEPWHYRYVGTAHSKVIGDLGGYVTLEEYIAKGGAQGFTEELAAIEAAGGWEAVEKAKNGG